MRRRGLLGIGHDDYCDGLNTRGRMDGSGTMLHRKYDGVKPLISVIARLDVKQSDQILSQPMVVSSEGNGMAKTGIRLRFNTEVAVLPRRVCFKNPFP